MDARCIIDCVCAFDCVEGYRGTVVEPRVDILRTVVSGTARCLAHGVYRQTRGSAPFLQKSIKCYTCLLTLSAEVVMKQSHYVYGLPSHCGPEYGAEHRDSEGLLAE